MSGNTITRMLAQAGVLHRKLLGPVRFLDRVSGPLQRDPGDPRISDQSSYDLNDPLQDYVRNNFLHR